MKHAILCIDDETDIVDALERLFRKKYEVLKASSGDEGLALLEHHQVAAIISDQRMPNMTGVEFFKKVKRSSPKRCGSYSLVLPTSIRSSLQSMRDTFIATLQNLGIRWI